MTKKIFFTTLLSAVLAGTVCADGRPVIQLLREITINSPFSKIVIDADIEVSLVDNNSDRITIEGQPVYAQKLKVENKTGVLYISAKGSLPKNKVKINVPVKGLEAIDILADAKVYSASALQSELINVLIDGNCQLSLLSTGEIVVNHTGSHRINFIKSNKIVIVKDDAAYGSNQ